MSAERGQCERLDLVLFALSRAQYVISCPGNLVGCRRFMEETLEQWVRSKFADRKDHAGKPYYGHCDFVANFARQYARALDLPDAEVDTVYQAGLCHDLLEDTDVSEMELLSRTSTDVLELVKVLTHRPSDSYEAYFEKILPDRLAVIVKLADTTHNAMLTRFDEAERTEALKDDCLAYSRRLLRLQHRIMAWYGGHIS